MRGSLTAANRDSRVISGAGHCEDVYRDLTGYIFDYETTSEAASKLVPEIFEIPEPARASLRFYQGDGGTLAPFREVAQLVHVQHKGRPLAFITRVVTNSPRTYEMYRRRGIPVSLGDVAMQVDAGIFTGWAEHPRGIRLCSAVMSIDKVEPGTPQEVVNHVSSARLVAAEAGRGEAIEVLELTWTFQVSTIWSGLGQCAYTAESPLDPLHELPVKRPIKARCLVGDAIINEGKVIGTLGRGGPVQTLYEAAARQLAMWGAGSPEDLAAFYTEDAVLIDPTRPDMLKGQTLEWFKGVQAAFGEFRIRVLLLQQIADNVVYHELLGTLNPGTENEQYLVFRSTVVWRKASGEWKIHHEQWDANPCDANGRRSMPETV